METTKCPVCGGESQVIIWHLDVVDRFITLYTCQNENCKLWRQTISNFDPGNLARYGVTAADLQGGAE